MYIIGKWDGEPQFFTKSVCCVIFGYTAPLHTFILRGENQTQMLVVQPEFLLSSYKLKKKLCHIIRAIEATNV